MFSDNVSGAPEPLTGENASRTHVSEGSTYESEAEMPAYHARVLVIGTFQSAESRISESHRAIYSEAAFSVD